MPRTRSLTILLIDDDEGDRRRVARDGPHVSDTVTFLLTASDDDRRISRAQANDVAGHERSEAVDGARGAPSRAH